MELLLPLGIIPPLKLALCIASNNQLLNAPSYHGIFWSGNRRSGRKLIFGRTFTLIQHIRELFLGFTLKSNELKSKSITILPSDDGEGDDNRRPSLRSLHMKMKTCSSWELGMALDFTPGDREIGHCSMA